MWTLRLSRFRWVGWLAAAVLIAYVALTLRVPSLDQRPMHGDEANQAVRTGGLLDEGVYHYDPNDHHGPVLYFAALPFCRATAKTFADTTEWNYRLVPVAFSLLTLALMLGLGALFPNRIGLYAAVLLTAVSPAMVYYSRFFIQESLLVTFLTGMLFCAVRYAATADRQSSIAWAAGFGACAGLAVATKETVVLSFAAAAIAAVAACGPRRLLRAWSTRDALLALGVAALVAVLLFSSFLTYPRGVYDALFSTVGAYAKRATAVPEHQHPWDFYVRTIFWFRYGKGPVWSEAGILIPAALAVAAAFWKPRTHAQASTSPSSLLSPLFLPWLRFTAVYTLVLTALYSAIPYKTPWCALSFLHGFILLAGVGIGLVFAGCGRLRWPPARVAAWAVLAVLVGLLVRRHRDQADKACFKLPADPRNPYVYAHTGTDAMNLLAEIERAAQQADGYDTLIAFAVPTPDTWPLPWYLRKYRRVGYWTSVAEIPPSLAPTVVVAAADQGGEADDRFGRGKRASFFGIRPGTLLNVFVPEK
ncbi:MAG: TIGR03663 family protein [Verrucomicrobiota bacterium]|jgi:uncharacterized protein (TIGR03663 family)|nr:TIGR03663 family protein [Verrucomicrobiota bacterium]